MCGSARSVFVRSVCATRSRRRTPTSIRRRARVLTSAASARSGVARQPWSSCRVDKTATLAISRMMERAEGAAYADLLRAAPTAWRTEAEEIGGGRLLVAPAADMLLFNRLVGCGVERAASREDVRAAVERLRNA